MPVDEQEAAFWRAIEADPADSTVRLAFADYLSDRDDPREAGMRSLAAKGAQAINARETGESPPLAFPYPFVFGTEDNESYNRPGGAFLRCLLPDDWFRKVRQSKSVEWESSWWTYFKTRADAEDAAARAFLRLPEPRRLELLAGTPAGVTST
jgi:uncharacterized protein (TIGR02996 family)